MGALLLAIGLVLFLVSFFLSIAGRHLRSLVFLGRSFSFLTQICGGFMVSNLYSVASFVYDEAKDYFHALLFAPEFAWFLASKFWPEWMFVFWLLADKRKT